MRKALFAKTLLFFLCLSPSGHVFAQTGGGQYVSCIYIMASQEKFVMTGVFMARTTPYIQWNNLLVGWKQHVEHSYNTDGVTSSGCSSASSMEQARQQRSQSIRQGVNGSDNRSMISDNWAGE